MRRWLHVRSDLETDVDVEKFGDEHNERDRNDQRSRSRVFQTRRVALWFDSGHGFVLYPFWALVVLFIYFGSAVLRSWSERYGVRSRVGQSAMWRDRQGERVVN